MPCCIVSAAYYYALIFLQLCAGLLGLKVVCVYGSSQFSCTLHSLIVAAICCIKQFSSVLKVENYLLRCELLIGEWQQQLVHNTKDLATNYLH